MGSICLSSASILRCDSLTRNQNIYLIIPTALEVIFSISLVFIDRGPGKRNLLLTAEGLLFLLLVVLELLAQTLPAVRGDLGLFKAFDLAIGILSFLPISLYTIFLYLLTNAEIVSVLPCRIKKIAKLALIFFIPAIITFNEIASFIGVSIRKIPARKAPETVIVGFFGSTQQELWTFFTSLTLALLAVFQAAIFCFAFFRLTQAILDQKRIENQRSDKAHLIKGIGWISGSLKLGMIETVVGFAGGGFGVVLTRRILRLLARASLCIGVAKGVDLVEDFWAVKNEIFMASGDKFHQSQLREFISNPRLSTFRQLSPRTTIFHAAQQASDIHEKSHRTLITAGLPDMTHFANIKAQNDCQLVTVRYNRGTPSLHMHFSMLDLPSPTTVAEEIKSRPRSEWDAHLSQPQPYFHRSLKSVFRDSADSVSSFAGPFELVTAPRRTLSQRSARAQLYQAASSAMSKEPPYPDPTTAVESQDAGCMQSMKSIPDSLQAVQDLAGEFPMPQALGSPSELQFKGQLPCTENSVSSDDSGSSNGSIVSPDNKSIRSGRQATLYAITGVPLKSAPFYSERPIDPFNDDDEEDACSPSRSADATVPGLSSLRDSETEVGDVLDLATVPDTGESRQPRSPNHPSSRQESPHDSDEKDAQTAERIGSDLGATRRSLQAEIPTELLQRSHERDHLATPCLKSPDIEEEDRRLLKAMLKRDVPLSRVTSVGKTPQKSIPLPIQASPERGLKPITIPPRAGNMPEILDDYEYGSVESTASGGGSH